MRVEWRLHFENTGLISWTFWLKPYSKRQPGSNLKTDWQIFLLTAYLDLYEPTMKFFNGTHSEMAAVDPLYRLRTAHETATYSMATVF